MASASAEPPEPVAGEKRTVVTQAMMLAIATGKEKLADYVDPKSGVVFIDGSWGDPASKKKLVEPALHCGKKLDALVTTYQARLASKDAGVQLARDEQRLSCSNKPGPPRCTLGAPMEYDPAVHLVFRLDAARGVRLAGITLNDEAAVGEDGIEQSRQDQFKTIEKLATKGCP